VEYEGGGHPHVGHSLGNMCGPDTGDTSVSNNLKMLGEANIGRFLISL